MHSVFGSLEGSIYDTVYVARISQIPSGVQNQPDLYDAGQARNVSNEYMESGEVAEAQIPATTITPTHTR